VITLLVAFKAVSPDILPIPWFETPLNNAAASSGVLWALNIVVAAIVGLGMVFLLFLELFPELIPMRKREALLLSSSKEGTVTIDEKSVRLLAERAGIANRNVRALWCRLKENQGSLVITCYASVFLESNVPEVSAELRERIKETVEQLTGLSVTQVDVRAKYEAGERGRKLLVP